MAVEPAVIVGYGRVGQALEKMGGEKDVVVKRGEKVPADSSGPILIATRNDALDGVIEGTPADRREGKRSKCCIGPAHADWWACRCGGHCNCLYPL